MVHDNLATGVAGGLPRRGRVLSTGCWWSEAGIYENAPTNGHTDNQGVLNGSGRSGEGCRSDGVSRQNVEPNDRRRKGRLYRRTLRRQGTAVDADDHSLYGESPKSQNSLYHRGLCAAARPYSRRGLSKFQAYCCCGYRHSTVSRRRRAASSDRATVRRFASSRQFGHHATGLDTYPLT